MPCRTLESRIQPSVGRLMRGETGTFHSMIRCNSMIEFRLNFHLKFNSPCSRESWTLQPETIEDNVHRKLRFAMNHRQSTWLNTFCVLYPHLTRRALDQYYRTEWHCERRMASETFWLKIDHNLLHIERIHQVVCSKLAANFNHWSSMRRSKY